MTFGIGKEEGAAEGVHRALKDDLGEALDLLAGDDGLGHRVHQVRRRLKRDRSLARVFDDATPDVARELRRTLRDAGRALASLRETHALAATAAELRSDLDAPAVAAVSAAVPISQPRTADSRIDAAGELIAAAVKLVADLPENGGNRLLDDAIHRAHRRVRRAHKKASHSHAMADLHEWRKRLKDLVHLLQFGGPRLTRRKKLLTWAEEAEERLGDDHDLAILRQRVVKLAPKGPSRVAGSVTIGRRRLDLQRRAFKLGRRIEKSSPPKLRRRP